MKELIQLRGGGDATTGNAGSLPDQAGMRMLAVVPWGTGKLSALAGLLVLLAWVAAALSGGLSLLLRRGA